MYLSTLMAARLKVVVITVCIQRYSSAIFNGCSWSMMFMKTTITMYIGFIIIPMVRSAAASEAINTFEAMRRSGVRKMATRTRKFPQTVINPDMLLKIDRNIIEAVENSPEQVAFAILRQ